MTLKKVLDISIDDLKKFNFIFENIGGFQARNLYIAAEILKEFIFDKKTTKILTFTGNLVSTGLRGIFRDLIKEKYFDLVITTCGTLDHDIAKTLGNYYQGFFELDDKELRKNEYHRLGNVLVPMKNYGIAIEKFIQSLSEEIYKEKKEISSYELCWKIGEKLNESSILFWANRNKIPIVVPGIFDGAVGYQFWLFTQKHRDFIINVALDEDLISDIVWKSEKLAGLIIGGGISKHHAIWHAQFKNGLDYAIYISTAIEEDGSLSGAKTREAISWNKIKENAKHINVFCDATIALPILLKIALEK
ncbi:MAG: deoxyhypusine synthase [Candidatus Aenigmatarchaeota archaeon]